MDIDIKAAGEQGISKATAWLTANLPGDEVVKTEDVAPAGQPPPSEQSAPETPKSETAKSVDKPGIADAIRRDREARAQAQAAQTEASKYKSEVESLRKEVELHKSLSATADPYEFLRGRKFTKEEQALWGQAFLYDLKPEVAPPDFRLELYKAEQARKEQAAKTEAETRAAEEAMSMRTATVEQYASSLIQHVQSSPGSCPESEMWFSEDGPSGQPAVNHQVYAQSLLATADNMARTAQQTGQQVDLSPANVARVLEAEVSKRQARRDSKRAGSAPVSKQVQPGTPAQGGEQATGATSAAGLRGGTPIPPATTEEERRARAAAILFGTK